MNSKLTDISSNTPYNGSLIHIVNPNNTSQDPAGSSFKTSLLLVENSFLTSSNNTEIIFNSGSRFDGTGSFTFNYRSQSLQQGFAVTASGIYSHAQGFRTTASGFYSHAEGYLYSDGVDPDVQLIASGTGSHAEGRGTTAKGNGSHSEGALTVASGSHSHAEGFETLARGESSHAEGQSTVALGSYSHAEGLATVTSGSYQHVQGQYNISSSAQSAFIIGNGIANNVRSNLVFASGSQFQVTGSILCSGAGTVKASSFNISDVSSLYEYVGTTILQTPENGTFAVGGGPGNISSSLHIPKGTVGIGTLLPPAASNAKLDVVGNVLITGSLKGSVSVSTITSTTASIDLSRANFFTLQLVSGSNTHISASNIRPGQTTSIRVTQPNPGTGSVTFSSAFKQPSGGSYTPTDASSAVDILTIISFDSTNAYVVNVNKLI